MGWKTWSAALACALAAGTAGADDRPASAAAEQRLGGDLFIGGGTVTVRQPVAGDLFATGGTVDIDAAVAGDALALGGKLRLGAEVEHSLFAAGGRVTVNGKVGRNLRVLGGQVELGPKGDVNGNLSAAGGQVRLYGRVGGHVQSAGGSLLIDGPVGGDVLATSGQIELGPSARIAGKLRYRSGEVLRQDPSAQVIGGVELLASGLGAEAASTPAARGRDRHGAGAAIGGVWTAGLIVLAAVLLAATPRVQAGVAQTMAARPGLSLLLGFVLLVCVPVAALLAMLTLIGIPLGLFLVALYLTLLPLAYVSTGIALGDWALQRWQTERAARLGWRIGAAAAALVALALLATLPWLGGVVALAALLAGLGALLLQVPALLSGTSAAGSTT